jgi:acetylornithine deacetylase
MLRFSLLLGIFGSGLCSLQQFPLGSLERQKPDDSSELLSLHQKLVEIESITGNEAPVGKWIASYLADKGLTVEKQELVDGRFNVFAYPGDQRKTQILMSSHIDTVPPFIPYSKKGLELWGRGSVDAKACVAAQTIAALRIFNYSASRSASPPSLGLLFVIGEEKGGDGMLYFSSHKPTNYSAIIFGEPTEGRLATGHKGMLSFSLHLTGIAAHSGYPWLGISANNYLVASLQALLKLEYQLPRSEKLGPSTLNIGKIEGGVAGNVVAEKATADISIRIAAGAPGEFKIMVENALEPIRATIEAAGGHFELEYHNESYGPVILDTDIPGFETIGVNYGTDVPNLSGNHKKYLYGPGSIQVAHGPREHLEVKELEDAVDAYEKIAKYLLHE